MLNDSSNTSAQREGGNPPLSIRGGTGGFFGEYVTSVESKGGYDLAVSIDWLRYSVAWPSGVIGEGGKFTVRKLDLPAIAFRAAVMPSEAFFLTGETLPTPRGYNCCLGLSHGSLRFHDERPEQKIGVELTGKSLSGLRVAGVDTIELLKWVVMRPGANVTRLDFAVDVFGSGGNPLDIWDAFVAGELVTAVRTGKPHNGKRRDGDRLVDVDRGVYIGSFHGDKLLRVYDKGLESGKGGDWIRIELQLNRPFANVYARALQDADDWQAVVRAAIRDYCDAPTVGWYSYALRGPVTRLPEVPRRDSDRKRWLLQQVLPALRAELMVCEAVGDWELYDAFQTVLDRYLFRDGGVSVLVERQ